MSKQGHPKGLYPLFFTEMWERLAFYLMLGILVLYTTDTERGGLGLPLRQAVEIYGTYMAFVYFTPFLGGMIADRFLGFRRAVFIGGLLMASGLFLLGVRSLTTLYAGLTLLCLGNGLFKPNISAMVGNLYEPGDAKRDAGFNIFYMGINVGAAASALLSAPLRNLFSFNMAFIAAGVGLVIGLVVLSSNWRKLERADRHSQPDPEDITFGQIVVRILVPAALCGALGYLVGERWDFVQRTIGAVTFAFLVGMLPIMGYFLTLWLKAKPAEKAGLGALIPVFVAGGTFFMILHLSGGLMTIYAEHQTNRQVPALAIGPYSQQAMPGYFGNAAPDVPRPDERTLVTVSPDVEAMFGARRVSETAVAQLVQDGLVTTAAPGTAVVAPGWGFLASRVYPDENLRVSTATDAHGVAVTTVRVVPETASAIGEVVFLREVDDALVPALLVSESTFAAVYQQASPARLAPGRFLGLVNAEMITALFNPVFVVLLTPVVVLLFGRLAARGRPVSTARKIFIGLILTTISLLIMVWSAKVGGNGAIKVSVMWLLIYYLVITFGELCLSPMGLSLVTKLAPRRYVGLMMGGWFLSTAVGNKLSGFISGLAPTAGMFFVLALATLAVALFIFVLLPKLDRAIKQYSA
ncbi:MAG: peptide MFS transporter [Candidatus Krumholzibacteria bacterium]|nr:peptide MFS transporter [Candidatus Krumholzibacteria bacterium]